MVAIRTNLEGYSRAKLLLEESPEILCGGFPCQDISTAGKGAGITGGRSGLWKAMLTTIRLVRPRYAIVENVAALLNRGMGTVLGDLASSGYDAEWDCIPACAVGADHIRDRCWIIAHDNARSYLHERGASGSPEEMGENAPNSDGMWKLQSQGCFAHIGRRLGNGIKEMFPRGYREHKPVMGRGIHGLSYRVDRIEGLGNCVVPQIPEIIGDGVTKYEQQRTKG